MGAVEILSLCGGINDKFLSFFGILINLHEGSICCTSSSSEE
jgi:hypothetical protein